MPCHHMVATAVNGLMSPLSLPHFSPIRAHIGVLCQIMQSVQKEVVEKKQKKLKQNFGHLYLGNGWSDVLQI